MAKRAEDPRKNEQTHHDSDVPPRKKHRFLFRFFRVMVILTVVLLLINVLIGFLYHGPRTMADVVQAMPGVPLFPLADLTKTNRLAQRAYTLPLLFMRLQGAEKAEFAQLQAPADNFFIVDWYRRSLPTMGWDFYGQQRLSSATRLIFIREHEGLQVMVGESHDIQTPIQLIYLAGLPRRQLVQLMHALPRGARAVPPPLGIRNSDKPQQKPAPQPTTGGDNSVQKNTQETPGGNPSATNAQSKTHERSVTSTQRNSGSYRHNRQSNTTTNRHVKHSSHRTSGRQSASTRHPQSQSTPKQPALSKPEINKPLSPTASPDGTTTP